MDEAALIQGLVRRDPTAQAEFVGRFGPKVAQWLCWKFPGIDDKELEDAAYEVLQKITRNPERFKPEKAKLSTYVYTAAKNRAIDLYRKSQRLQRAIHAGDLESALDAATEEGETMPTRRERQSASVALSVTDDYPSALETGDDPGPFYPAELGQRAQAMLAALQLTPEKLDHLRMRLFDRLPGKEIANIIGISEVNERVRWFRLRAQIAQTAQEFPELAVFAKSIGVTATPLNTLPKLDKHA